MTTWPTSAIIPYMHMRLRNCFVCPSVSLSMQKIVSNRLAKALYQYFIILGYLHTWYKFLQICMWWLARNPSLVTNLVPCTMVPTKNKRCTAIGIPWIHSSCILALGVGRRNEPLPQPTSQWSSGNTSLCLDCSIYELDPKCLAVSNSIIWE